MPGTAPLSATDRCLLYRLQRQALTYFLDNQTANGLLLDRQANHGPRRVQGFCSTATTGMGFIALAIASSPPYRLLDRGEAVRRVRTGLDTALESLPHQRGVMPHFLDARTGAVSGVDHLSTIDSAWLIAGALWAASFLGDAALSARAERLYDRVDWRFWTDADRPGESPLLRHGMTRAGRFLGCSWDRLNGETVFMYLLAAGATAERAVPATVWRDIQPFYGTTAGYRYHSADLGLFVFQYGLDLIDAQAWQVPHSIDLFAEAGVAVDANERCCRTAADRFATYRQVWGLSAGDGPCGAAEPLAYRAYAPSGPIDGTAHVSATLASIAHRPALVLENVQHALRYRDGAALGRYGFSTINVDQRWLGPDMVGIDAGAIVIALDNVLEQDRVRTYFHELPCISRGFERSGWRRRHPEQVVSAAA